MRQNKKKKILSSATVVIMLMMMMLTLPVTSEEVLAQPVEMPEEWENPPIHGGNVWTLGGPDADFADAPSMESGTAAGDIIHITGDISLQAGHGASGYIPPNRTYIGMGGKIIGGLYGGVTAGKYIFRDLVIDATDPTFGALGEYSVIIGGPGVKTWMFGCEIVGNGGLGIVTYWPGVHFYLEDCSLRDMSTALAQDHSHNYGPENVKFVAVSCKFFDIDRTCGVVKRYSSTDKLVSSDVTMSQCTGIRIHGDKTNMTVAIINSSIDEIVGDPNEWECQNCIIKSADFTSPPNPDMGVIGILEEPFRISITPEMESFEMVAEESAIRVDLTDRSQLTVYGLEDGSLYGIYENGLIVDRQRGDMEGNSFTTLSSGTIIITVDEIPEPLKISIGIAAIFIAAGLVIVLLCAAAAGWRRR